MGFIWSFAPNTGSDTDVHLITSHTLRLGASSCDDIVTEKRIYDPLQEQLKKLWELEAIGVSTQEETVHEKSLDIIHLNNGRYEVSPPWNEQHALLPHNYAQVVSRLVSVLKRLRKNPGLFEEYNASSKSNPREG